MKLVKARVEGYRCVKDETIDLGSLTALVGSGGVGKSALLRAIDWCVNERSGEEEDLYRDPEGNAAERIVVTLHFADIGEPEAEALGRYAAGDQTTIARIWTPGESPVLSGSAYFYEPFDAVRAEKGAKKTAAYKALFDAEGEDKGYPTPRATKVADVDAHMAQFERENADTLCELRPPEATHLSASPAAQSSVIASTMSSSVRTPTPLTRSARAVTRRSLGCLPTSVASTRRPRRRSTAFGLKPRRRPTPSMGMRARGAAQPRARDHRSRAGLCSRCLGPSHRGTRSGGTAKPKPKVQIVHGGGYPTDRAVAAALLRLSAGTEDETGPQIAYSTHSERFVKPALFEDLRVVRREGGTDTSVVAADPRLVEGALEEVGLADRESQVRNTLSASLSQAVFAKRVVLCEGRTDSVLLEAVASTDRPFEQDGIAVAECHGKSIIPVALAILNGLGIPCFVLFDADSQIKEKLEESDKGSQAERDAQITAIATKNRQLLELCGEAPEDWPDRDVRDRCANFTGNVESDILMYGSRSSPSATALLPRSVSSRSPERFTAALPTGPARFPNSLSACSPRFAPSTDGTLFWGRRGQLLRALIEPLIL